jgi:hypothetical protein
VGRKVFGLGATWDKDEDNPDAFKDQDKDTDDAVRDDTEIGAKRGLEKTREYYGLRQSSPMFHPREKNWKQVNSAWKDKIDDLIDSYNPEIYKSCPEIKPDDEGDLYFFQTTKDGGTVGKSDQPDIIGTSFSTTLSMLSVMAHVDTLHENTINADSPHKKALLSIRHNCQPCINHRPDLRLRYHHVHDRRYSRKDVQGQKSSIDLLTVCLGFHQHSHKFAGTLLATPMEVTKDEDDGGEILSYDHFPNTGKELSRMESVKQITFKSLSELYSVVVDPRCRTLEHVIRDNEKYSPCITSEKYDAAKAKAVVRVTHFVLDSISKRFNAFQTHEDFVRFALRLYHIDPDIKRAFLEVSPQWLGIWYRVDTLIYFTRIMFNKLFNFRLPLIDGATKKFAADMGLMRLLPVCSVEEAANPEEWVVPILNDDCDEDNFIANIVTTPVTMDLVTLTSEENMNPEKQLEIWERYSNRKQLDDQKVGQSSARLRACVMIDNQTKARGAILNTEQWGQEGGAVLNKTFWNKKMMAFRKVFIEDILEKTSPTHLCSAFKPKETEFNAKDLISKEFCSTDSRLWQNRWNADEKVRGGSLLPLSYLCFFVVHNAAAAEENPHLPWAQQDILLAYLEGNGVEAPFWRKEHYLRDGDEKRRDGKKKHTRCRKSLYAQSHFQGNIPQDDNSPWGPHVDWVTHVLHKYVGFFTAAAHQLLENERSFSTTKGAGKKEEFSDLARELLGTTAVSDFMEAVNEFGHEIPVPMEWGKLYPGLAGWMRPVGFGMTGNTRTNIPQALALLTILSTRNVDRNPHGRNLCGATVKCQWTEKTEQAGLMFHKDWLGLFSDTELFPLNSKKQRRTFDPAYHTFARAQFKLKDKDGIQERYCATQMLVHMMKKQEGEEEKEHEKLLCGIEETISELPSIGWWLKELMRKPNTLGKQVTDCFYQRGPGSKHDREDEDERIAIRINAANLRRLGLMKGKVFQNLLKKYSVAGVGGGGR